MRGQARVSLSLLLWVVLLMTSGAWLLSVSSVATSAQSRARASASRRPKSCRSRHHRCCSPPAARSHRFVRSRCLEIAVAPNPSTAGQTVTITGRLLTPRSHHVVIVLWRRFPGRRRFHPTEATRTDRMGRYAMSARIDSNRWWYVTAKGIRSRTVRQRVLAVITLAASQTRAAPGDQVTFTGSVLPSHAGAQIVLQQFGAGGWQPVAQGRIGSASTFSIDYAFAGDGVYELRAYLPGAASNINSYSWPTAVAVNGIFKIKHVVIIMQENRSFDQYFGTFPGADGIPGLAGNSGAVPCVPDPVNGGCVQPFHDTSDKNFGGPHGAANATADMDCTSPALRTGCAMEGFVAQAEKGQNCTSNDPSCSPCTAGAHAQCIDAMGYHDGGEIPNYWAYARNYVLQDHMYEPNASWSLPEHLFQVSEWSAFCTDPLNPTSCTNALQNPNPSDGQPHYAWTGPYLSAVPPGRELEVLIVSGGTQPDCANEKNGLHTRPCRDGEDTRNLEPPAVLRHRETR